VAEYAEITDVIRRSAVTTDSCLKNSALKSKRSSSNITLARLTSDRVGRHENVFFSRYICTTGPSNRRHDVKFVNARPVATLFAVWLVASYYRATDHQSGWSSTICPSVPRMCRERSSDSGDGARRGSRGTRTVRAW